MYRIIPCPYESFVQPLPAQATPIFVSSQASVPDGSAFQPFLE